jgi:hypothetical protein
MRRFAAGVSRQSNPKAHHTAGKETVLHGFGGGSDGIAPYASLVNVKGKLYGTTSGGFGFDGYGTVFALTP